MAALHWAEQQAGTGCSNRMVAMPKSYIERARVLILTAAFLSFLGSVVLYFFDNREHGIFVGLWGPRSSPWVY